MGLRSCPAASSCRVPRAPRTAVGRVSSCCPLRSLAPSSFFRGDSANHLYAERAAESLFPLPLDVVSPVRGLQSTLTTVCMVAQGRSRNETVLLRFFSIVQE